MLLYNITLILDESVADKWLVWMQNIHVPAIIGTELFVSYRLLKVLDSPNEGVTYCVQFVAETDADYQKYKTAFEPRLKAEMNTKFANKIVSFATLMEFLDS